MRTLEPKTASEKGYYFYNVIQITDAEGYDEGTITDPHAGRHSRRPTTRPWCISLENPAPQAFFVLNSFQTTPLHKPSFEKFGDKFVEAGNQVGNGAYVLKENVPQSHVTAGEEPELLGRRQRQDRQVNYVVTEDVNTELKRYQAGEIDITNEIPSDQREAAEGRTRRRGSRSDQHGDRSTISFNVTKPPFDDIRVRQALSMAIDRETLQDKVLKAGYKAELFLRSGGRSDL